MGASALASQAARLISPRHRHWRRLGASLTLDPDRLERPIPEPARNDFVICGLSRSGTSLLAAALYQPPRVVTVMEPWDGLRYPPAELFESLRREMSQGRLGRGRLDVALLTASGEVRWGRDGQYPHDVVIDPDASVGVKWPIFWRYLPLLPTTKFLVCIRHPAEVLASFASMDGTLGEGLDYGFAFNREMNQQLKEATEDPEFRRVLLLEYVASRIVPYLERPNVFVVRYERWFDDREGLMASIATFLGIPLGPGFPEIRPPKNTRHDPETLAMLRDAAPSATRLGYTI
jgi:hypothetical protein